MKKSLLLLVSIIFTTAFVTFMDDSPRADIFVCESNCDFQTIQEAIDDPQTKDGDIIELLDPVHTEKGIIVSRDITIQGSGPGDQIIQAHQQSNMAGDRVFTIPAGQTVMIRNLIIRNGRPDTCPMYGGGLFNEGNLTLDHVTLRDNIGSAGGAIMNMGILHIIDSLIEDNLSLGYGAGGRCGGHGGAIMTSDGTVTIENSIIRNNESDKESGGAAYVSCKSELKVINSLIVGNKARSLGGAFYVKGKLDLLHTTITHNSARTNGSGIYIKGQLDSQYTVIAENNNDGIVSDCILGDDHSLGIVQNNFVSDGTCSAEFSGTTGWEEYHQLDDTWLPLPVSGSTMLDAVPGNQCIVNSDVRGMPRPVAAIGNFACDLGAIETQRNEITAHETASGVQIWLVISQILIMALIFLVIKGSKTNIS